MKNRAQRKYHRPPVKCQLNMQLAGGFSSLVCWLTVVNLLDRKWISQPEHSLKSIQQPNPVWAIFTHPHVINLQWIFPEPPPPPRKHDYHRLPVKAWTESMTFLSRSQTIPCGMRRLPKKIHCKHIQSTKKEHNTTQQYINWNLPSPPHIHIFSRYLPLRASTSPQKLSLHYSCSCCRQIDLIRLA